MYPCFVGPFTYLGLIAMVDLVGAVELVQSIIKLAKADSAVGDKVRQSVMLNMLDAHGVVNGSCAGEGTQKFVDTDEHKLQLVVVLAGVEGMLHHKNGSQKRKIRFYAKVSMVSLGKKKVLEFGNIR